MFGEYFSAWIVCAVSRYACGFRSSTKFPTPPPMYKEVTEDYNGIIPVGFDVVTLPEADYLMFQGEPFEEEDYCDAIFAVQTAMDRYEPAVIGYFWDDANPRIQLEPRGERGYIELRAVRKEQVVQK